MYVCPSVCLSIRPSVRPSVRPSLFVNSVRAPGKSLVGYYGDRQRDVQTRAISRTCRVQHVRRTPALYPPQTPVIKDELFTSLPSRRRHPGASINHNHGAQIVIVSTPIDAYTSTRDPNTVQLATDDCSSSTHSLSVYKASIE